MRASCHRCRVINELSAKICYNSRHILLQMSGSRVDEAQSKRHARFAAACAVNALLCEEPAWQVSERWGKPGVLSKAGEPGRSRTCSSGFTLTGFVEIWLYQQ